METLFSALTNAVQQVGPVSAGAALIWGVLSVLLSPCHLASIPLIVGFINGQGRVTRRRAFALALLFSLGILATITVVGVVINLIDGASIWSALWGSILSIIIFIYLLTPNVRQAFGTASETPVAPVQPAVPPAPAETPEPGGEPQE